LHERNGFSKPFLYFSRPLSPPTFPILSSNNPSTSSSNLKGRNAYWFLGLILGALLLWTAIIFALPRTAGAFWPFSVARAQTAGQPVLHDASLNLLAAPLSTNVSNSVDPSSFTTPDGSALVSGGELGTSTSSQGDTITAPTSGDISQYTVKEGDNLSIIAQNFGVSVNTILWANNITNKSTVKAGTVLVILPVSGVQHTVRSGETLSSIASKFSADANDIAQFNGLPADGTLDAGSTIIIPGGELPAAKSPTKSTSNKTTPSKIKTKSSSPVSSASSDTTSSGSASGATNYSDATGNPYKGGSGSARSGFFVNPVPGALLTQGIHGWNGADLGAPRGTAIGAAAAGTVILARTGGWNGGYGNYVIIDNGHGIQTLYAHMTSVRASAGDSVSAGDTIGTVGTTGEATGPHLHFEVRGARNPFASCTEMTVCSPQ
jgi:murein DD-endopeptidase MepM/ murein hydrolase activator NlpD